MATKVIVEGTGSWVGLKRGERRATVLDDRLQRKIDRGFVRVVDQFEIADHQPPPAPTLPENPSAGPAYSGSASISDDSPEPPEEEPTPESDEGEAAAPKAHRARRPKTTTAPADG